jgi:hypothetical protein
VASASWPIAQAIWSAIAPAVTTSATDADDPRVGRPEALTPPSGARHRLRSRAAGPRPASRGIDLQVTEGAELDAQQPNRPPEVPAQLVGIEWRLAHHRGPDGDLVAVPADVLATAVFVDGRVAGTTGCNRYDATYVADGPALSVGPLATTMMACEPARLHGGKLGNRHHLHIGPTLRRDEREVRPSVVALLSQPRRLILLVAVVVAACSTGPSPPPISGPASTPPLATPKLSYTAAPLTPPLSPVPTSTPQEVVHGRPYKPEDVFPAIGMLPPSYPLELRRPEYAQPLADAMSEGIWSYDGKPYLELHVDARCADSGPFRCEVTVAGIPSFVPARDYADWFSWEVTDTRVRLMDGNQLGGLPADLQVPLDQLARSLDTEHRLEGLELVNLGWVIPPPEDAYILRYSDGLEETGTTLYVTVDRQARRIVSISRQG